MTRADEIKVLLNHQVDEVQKVSSHVTKSLIRTNRMGDYLGKLKGLVLSIESYRLEFDKVINESKS